MQDRDIITERSHELYKTTWSPITSSGGRNHKIITVIINYIIDKYINITVYKRYKWRNTNVGSVTSI